MGRRPAKPSIALRASPELRPGPAFPEIDAERNRLKWEMTAGAVVSWVRTTELSGTICPAEVRA